MKLTKKFKEDVKWYGGKMENYKWIQFQVVRNTSRTQVWQVAARDVSKNQLAGPTILGEVKWFGKWRKYSFFPETNTVFEQDCLRDIAHFCYSRNTDHKWKLEREKDMKKQVRKAVRK
jgi:hypothetical protein